MCKPELEKVSAVTDMHPAESDNDLWQFLDSSPCPFAQRAAVVRAGPWADPWPNPARLDGFFDQLRIFTHDPSRDVAVLELRDAKRLGSVEDGARLVHTLLRGLRNRDRTIRKPLDAGILDPAWDFRFCGHAFFISLFAPFYPDGHPRCSGVDDVAFVLFQPERGFRRFGISSKAPKRARLSNRVAGRFAQQGVEYDHRLNAATPKALRYVKPVKSEDPAVRWWESALA